MTSEPGRDSGAVESLPPEGRSHCIRVDSRQSKRPLILFESVPPTRLLENGAVCAVGLLGNGTFWPIGLLEWNVLSATRRRLVGRTFHFSAGRTERSFEIPPKIDQNVRARYLSTAAKLRRYPHSGGRRRRRSVIVADR